MSALQYGFTFTEHEYSTLMRLVMAYGTGASTDGISTSINLRKKLANPEVSSLVEGGVRGV